MSTKDADDTRARGYQLKGLRARCLSSDNEVCLAKVYGQNQL